MTNQNVSENRQITSHDVFSILKTVALLFGPEIITKIIELLQGYSYGSYTTYVMVGLGIALKFLHKYYTKSVYPQN